MWIPLHVHSQYSILDATASVALIAQQAKAFGMPAVALTDHGNLFGAIEFFKECKSVGVKPIIGCEIYIAPESRLDKKKERGQATSYHQTLLAKNMTGYRNLCRLSSVGFLEGFYYNPRIDFELLKQHSEGLICLSGCMSSRISQEILEGTKEGVIKLIDWYIDVFGEDFYLELQRHHMTEEQMEADGLYQETWLIQNYKQYIDNQEKINATLIEIGKLKGIKCVATNDSHYINRDDWRAHEILLNIQSGEPVESGEHRTPNPKRRVYSSHEVYFKSQEEMITLFRDIPEAISNTLEIGEKCQLEIDFKTKYYPVFTPPEKESVENYLWRLCEEGIPKRYTTERLAKVKEIYPDKEPIQVVRDRLTYEMSVIAPKGMCDYLLIVWDFINWAKQNGIPMGPGRGSGAGSIVLYLIGITDIEPLRFHLFFERFINPERLSYPDIDVDICMDRRSEVIQYTLQKYGKENVAQIITFGTMKAKMVIRDVARVLSVPLSKVNAIAKLIPEDLNITLEKALEKDPDLRKTYEEDDDARRIIDIGKRLEGSIRNTGTHAAGIIISGEPLTNLIPICTAKDSEMPVTQYSMKPVEQVGMLKVDFLGLKTLTAVQICVDAIKAATGKEIDWVNLPLDDKPTFELLNQGKTLGIFQLESGGMQDLSRNLHLDKFEEIIAVTALYRPGPMDMIPSYINRKHGREAIENDHPWMKDILDETYGIMVYQEQVMQIASKLARYSLGEGDVLRRAMGKKDMAEMAKQRDKFRKGASENGIDEETSMRIFDKMEKFAAYGFNKSHAAAYGYLSYVTAYLKANYPKEWMAALMTCDSHDLTKVAKFIREAKAMGIPMLPPDVNEAGTTFVATSQGIRFAMSGIKGVGTAIVEAIVEDRTKKGAYKNFYEFFERVGTLRVGKKMIENLVSAGSFDFTGWSRDALLQSIDIMYETASKEQKETASGVMSLFSLMGEKTSDRFKTAPTVKLKSTKNQLLLKEKELLGFFLNGHPMDEYKEILRRLSCVPLRKVPEMDHDSIFRCAFLVESVNVRFSSKSGRKFAILMINDGIESMELPIWSDLYEEKHHLLLENQLLYAVLQVDKREETPKISCQWFDDLTKVTENMIQQCDQAFDKAKQRIARFSQLKQKAPPQKEVKVEKLSLKLNADVIRHSQILQLKDLFCAHPGKSPVQIEFETHGRTLGIVHIETGVTISPVLLSKLKDFPGVIGNL